MFSDKCQVHTGCVILKSSDECLHIWTDDDLTDAIRSLNRLRQNARQRAYHRLEHERQVAALAGVRAMLKEPATR